MIRIISVKLIVAIFVIFFSTVIKYSLLASENKILIKVNNELITTIDILNEINYLKSINEDINNLENKKIIEIARKMMISKEF